MQNFRVQKVFSKFKIVFQVLDNRIQNCIPNFGI